MIVPHPKYLIDYGDVPAELACTFACAGLTAYSAIRKVAPLTEDDHLVLIGAGGVGLSGLHIAPSVVPAKLIVADVDPQKRGIARQAGAFATIDNGEPDAVAKVMELTGGGARAAIDFVGAPQTARFGFDILRKGGTLIHVGLYGGAMTASAAADAAARADPARLLCRHARGDGGGHGARPRRQGAADPARSAAALGGARRRLTTCAPAGCRAASSCGRTPEAALASYGSRPTSR